ncbi:hypothetical protein NP233_g3542 [Leucocoprinus birnbaumii]|uniref:Uncharacterized protein n=1 Tax=Leucocoprinus birnbaumii TaxID=56174 RepID=A0AAD5YWC2_9AGAR|nr:hypothetical protein NP233_g3542 [Leucocoprinus birnbaumii]
MGDVSRRLDVVPDAPHVPSNTLTHQQLSPFTDTQHTESDLDDDDSDDYFHYGFPQPPSITPALRRMRSSPWYSQQLEAISSKPERRHSVSPLIQNPDGWTHPLLRSDPQSSTGQDAEISRELARMGLVPRETPQKAKEDPAENHRCQRSPLLQSPSRRLENLPPPVPAPSIPLPRLPRIIRKVASMRSESKQVEHVAESVAPPRRPVPKIRSLKFMSGSMLGSTNSQPTRLEERKRSWSFSRPTSFQKPKVIPAQNAPYITLNGVNNLSASCDPPSLAFASPAVYSNPCLLGNNQELSTGATVAFNPEGHFDLSRSTTASLAPPFAHRVSRSSGSASNRYSNNSCGESTLPNVGASPGKTGSTISHDHPGPSQQRPAHPLYSVSSEGKGKNASSGPLLQGAKSFINITPEKRNGRRSRPKSGSSSYGLGIEGGDVGHQVGTAVKGKGEKVRRLFARASNGVVDWGRQLTGRSTRSVAASSTSGSLAPLTGERSSK